MTRHAMLGGAILVALGLMAGSAFAQGHGGGNCPYGAPAGQGGPGSIYCTGQGPGAGFGAGAAQGWRGRVAGMADVERETGALRTQLRAANRAAGLCNGTGPHAYGLNGGGFGRGAGQGYCNGAGRGRGGRWGAGQGMGRGMGLFRAR